MEIEKCWIPCFDVIAKWKYQLVVVENGFQFIWFNWAFFFFWKWERVEKSWRIFRMMMMKRNKMMNVSYWKMIWFEIENELLVSTTKKKMMSICVFFFLEIEMSWIIMFWCDFKWKSIIFHLNLLRFFVLTADLKRWAFHFGNWNELNIMFWCCYKQSLLKMFFNSFESFFFYLEKWRDFWK